MELKLTKSKYLSFWIHPSCMGGPPSINFEDLFCPPPLSGHTIFKPQRAILYISICYITIHNLGGGIKGTWGRSFIDPIISTVREPSWFHWHQCWLCESCWLNCSIWLVMTGLTFAQHNELILLIVVFLIYCFKQRKHDWPSRELGCSEEPLSLGEELELSPDIEIVWCPRYHTYLRVSHHSQSTDLRNAKNKRISVAINMWKVFFFKKTRTLKVDYLVETWNLWKDLLIPGVCVCVCGGGGGG